MAASHATPHAMDIIRNQKIVTGGSSGDLIRITALVGVCVGIYFAYKKWMKPEDAS
jgi:hypothetical protein